MREDRQNSMNISGKTQSDSNMYVLYLDTARVLWLIASGLFVIGVSFLVGYYLGNNIASSYIGLKERVSSEERLLAKEKVLSEEAGMSNDVGMSLKEVEAFSNINEVKAVTKAFFENKKDTTTAKNSKNHKSSLSSKKIRAGAKSKKVSSKSTRNTKKQLLRKANKYSIQLAAYRSKKNALFYKNKLYAKWKSKAHVVVKKDKAGKYMYVLRIGKFESLQAAKKAKAKVSKQGFFKNDSFILKS